METNYFDKTPFEKFYKDCLDYLTRKNFSHFAPIELAWEETYISRESFANYKVAKIFKIEPKKYVLDATVLIENDLSYYSAEISYLKFSVFINSIWIKFEFIYDIDKDKLSVSVPEDF